MENPRIRVFVVDDDPPFRSSMKRFLQLEGIFVNCFESARAFLDSVPCGQKGIAVVDIHMPKLDGFYLMEQMKSLGYDMPVILITGQTGPDTRDKAIDMGAVGFLQKPFHARSLMALIEEQENQRI